MKHLPASAPARKRIPIFSGVLKYFPDALVAVAECSFEGNEQHNPGTDLHWDRAKSGDERDALARHLLEAGTVDTDGVRHSTKVAWRALAALQKELEDAAAHAADPLKGAKVWDNDGGPFFTDPFDPGKLIGEISNDGD